MNRHKQTMSRSRLLALLLAVLLCFPHLSMGAFATENARSPEDMVQTQSTLSVEVDGEEPGSGDGEESGPGDGEEPSPGDGEEPGSDDGEEPGPGEVEEPGSDDGEEPGPGDGEEPGPDDGEEADPIEIMGFLNYDRASDEPFLTLEADVGTVAEALALPDSLKAQMRNEDGELTQVDVPVTWLCNTYDPDMPGEYLFAAVPDSGYRYDGPTPMALVTLHAQLLAMAEEIHTASNWTDLQTAVEYANANKDNQVTIHVTQPITMEGMLTIAEDVELTIVRDENYAQGTGDDAGWAYLKLSAGANRHFTLDTGATLKLIEMTLQGSVDGDAPRGGILVTGDNVTVDGAGLIENSEKSRIVNCGQTSTLNSEINGGALMVKDCEDFTARNLMLESNQLIYTTEDAQAQVGGGALTLLDADKAVLEGLVFRNNKALIADGVSNAGNGGGGGGAVYISGTGKSVSMSGSEFYKNESCNQGGGLFIRGAAGASGDDPKDVLQVMLSDTVFSGNEAILYYSGRGGAISMQWAALNMAGGVHIGVETGENSGVGNTAPWGGGISLDGNTIINVTGEDNFIQYNTTDADYYDRHPVLSEDVNGRGGGLHADSDNNKLMNDGSIVIRNNVSHYQGGGIFLGLGGSLEIQNNATHENNPESPTMRITGNQVTPIEDDRSTGVASGGGIAVMSYNAKFSLSGQGITEISNNIVTAISKTPAGKEAEHARGGGTFVIAASMTLDTQGDGKIIIKENQALGNAEDRASAFGGGIYVGNGTVENGTRYETVMEIKGTVEVLDNLATCSEDAATARGCGGGIYTGSNGGSSNHANSTLKVTDSANITITGNRAGYDGGGLVLYGNMETGGAITVTGNTAGIGGGVLVGNRTNWTHTGELTVTDNEAVKVKNRDGTSGQGGGIYFESYTEGEIKLESGTITVENNEAEVSGGGLYLSRRAVAFPEEITLEVKNNEAQLGGGIYVTEAASLALEGTGAIENNTASVNAGGIYIDLGSGDNVEGYKRLTVGENYTFSDNTAPENIQLRWNTANPGTTRESDAAAFYSDYFKTATASNDSAGVAYTNLLNGADINFYNGGTASKYTTQIDGLPAQPGQEVTRGSVLTYRLAYVNSSAAAVTNVKIQDTAGNGLTLTGGYQVDNEQNTLLVAPDGKSGNISISDTIAVGGRVELVVQAKVADDAAFGATVENSMLVTAGENDTIVGSVTAGNPVQSKWVKLVKIDGRNVEPDAEVYPGAEVVYEIQYTNPSSQEIDGFTLTGKPGEGLTLVGGEIKTPDGGGAFDKDTGVFTFTNPLGQSESVTVTVTAKVEEDAEDTVTVEGSVDGTYRDGTGLTDADKEIGTATNPVGEVPEPGRWIKLIKIDGRNVEPDAEVYPGAEVEYEVHYTNKSGKTIENLTLTPEPGTGLDMIGGQVTKPDGGGSYADGVFTFTEGLENGEEVTVIITGTIEDDAADKVTVGAKVDGKHPGDEPLPDMEKTIPETENPVGAVPEPDRWVKLVKIDGRNVEPDAEVYPGAEVEYEIHYTNKSGKTIENLTLTPEPGTGLDMIGGQVTKPDGGGSYADGVFTFTEGLENGEEVTVIITGTVEDDAADKVTVGAKVDGNHPGDEPLPDMEKTIPETENPVGAVPEPDRWVKLIKIDGRNVELDAEVYPGAEVEYEVHYTNKSGKTIENLTLTPEPGTGLDMTGGTVTKPDGGGSYADGVFTFTEGLENGEEVTVIITGTIEDDAADKVTVGAKVDGKHPGDEPLPDMEKIIPETENPVGAVPEPDRWVKLVKIDGRSVEPDAEVYPGAEVEYEVHYTNKSGKTIENLTLTPEPGTGLDMTGGQVTKPDGGGSYADGVFTFTEGLGNGEEVTVIITGTVEDDAADKVTVGAKVDGNHPSDEPLPDMEKTIPETENPVGAVPEPDRWVKLVKIDGRNVEPDAEVYPGAEVEYEIHYTNKSGKTIENLTLTPEPSTGLDITGGTVTKPDGGGSYADGVFTFTEGLENGEEVTVIITGTIEDDAADKVTVGAKVDGKHPGDEPLPDMEKIIPETENPVGAVPEPDRWVKLVKIDGRNVEPDAEVYPGAEVEYEIHYTNKSGKTIENLTLTPEPGTGLDITGGQITNPAGGGSYADGVFTFTEGLENGEEVTVIITGTIEDDAADKVTVGAKVDGKHPGDEPLPDMEKIIPETENPVGAVPEPDRWVKLIKIDGRNVEPDAEVYPGAEVEYEVHYTNKSGKTIENLTLTPEPGTGLDMTGGTVTKPDGGGSYADGVFTFTEGLENGEEVTVIITGTVEDDAADKVTVGAKVDGNHPGDEALDDREKTIPETENPVGAVPEPDRWVKLIKIDGRNVEPDAEVYPGAEVEYEVHYTNKSGKTIENLTLTPEPSTGLDITGGQVTKPDGGGSYADGVFTFTEGLENGEEVTVIITGTVEDDAADKVTVGAKVDGNHPGDEALDDREKTIPETENPVGAVPEPDRWVKLIKIDGRNVEPDAEVYPGAEVEYEVHYTNKSGKTIEDLTLTPEPGTGLDMTGGQVTKPAGGGSYADGVFTFTEDLENGEEVTVIITGTIEDDASDKVTVGAKVDGNHPGDEALDGREKTIPETENPVGAVPEPDRWIKLVKIDGRSVEPDTEVYPGAEVEYEIHYTNKSGKTIENLKLTPEPGTGLDMTGGQVTTPAGGGSYADGVFTFTEGLENGEEVTVIITGTITNEASEKVTVGVKVDGNHPGDEALDGREKTIPETENPVGAVPEPDRWVKLIKIDGRNVEPDAEVYPGAEVEYEIHYTNKSGKTIENLTLTPEPGTGLDITGGTVTNPDGGGSYADGVFTFTEGLENGEEVTVIITGTITNEASEKVTVGGKVDGNHPGDEALDDREKTIPETENPVGAVPEPDRWVKLVKIDGRNVEPDAEVYPGAEVEYEVHYTNKSGKTIENLKLTPEPGTGLDMTGGQVTKPDGGGSYADGVFTFTEGLENGEEVTVIITGTIEDDAADKVTVGAKVDGNHPGDEPLPDMEKTIPETENPVGAVPEPDRWVKLIKIDGRNVEPDAEVYPGAEVEYEIHYTNKSGKTIENLTLTPEPGTGLDMTGGTVTKPAGGGSYADGVFTFTEGLENGEEVTVIITGTITNEASEKVTVGAKVDGNHPGDEPLPDMEKIIPETENPVGAVPTPDRWVKLIKIDGRNVEPDSEVYSGAEVKYEVHYTNKSGKTIENLKLTPEPGTGLDMTGGTYENGVFTFTEGLENGEEVTVVITGTITNEASEKVTVGGKVDGNHPGDEALDDREKTIPETENPVGAVPEPDRWVKLVKIDGRNVEPDAEVYPGAEVEYEIQYTNPAAQEIDGFTLTGKPGEGLTLVDGEIKTPDGGGSFDKDTGVFTFTNSLGPGETVTVTVTAKVDEDAEDTVTVEGSVDGTYRDGTGLTDADKEIGTATNTIGKKPGSKYSSEIDGRPAKAGEPVRRGSEVVYTITFVNREPVAVKNLRVTDIAGPGLTLQSGRVMGNDTGTFDASTGVFQIHGEVPAGDTLTMEVTARVNDDAQNDVENKTLFQYVRSDNGTEITDEKGSPATINKLEHKGSKLVEVDGQPAGVDGQLYPGAEVVYEIHYTNRSEQAIEGFTLTSKPGPGLSVTDGKVITPVDGGDFKVDEETGTGVFTFNDPLKPGGHVVVRVTGKVDENVTGSITNNVSVDGTYADGTPIPEEEKTIPSDGSVVSEESFEVRFHLSYEGGGLYAQKTYKIGARAEQPAKPQRNSYTFEGWYLEPACTTAYDFTKPVTSNLDLYAKWKEKVIEGGTEGGGSRGGTGESGTTVWMTFYVNYGIGEDTVYLRKEVRSGEKLDKPEDPKRTFYTFEGWYLEPECVTAFDFSQAVNKDTALYAKWKLVAFDDNHYAYIIGFEDGTVRPQANLTRAQTATIFFRILEEELRTNAYTKENSFTDVAKSDWYNKAVSTMAGLDLLQGDPSGAFRGNDTITREEFAAIVARFLGVSYSGPDKFTDIGDTWGRDAINAAAEAGWFLGDNTGMFRPKDAISRAEAVAVINRVTGRRPQSTEDLLTDQMQTWQDNQNTGAWYYLDMQEATNSHDHQPKEDGVHEVWTGMTTPPDWGALENPDPEDR